MKSYGTSDTIPIESINKNMLLDNIDQCQVWSDLLQISLSINPYTNRSMSFCNPWRKDRKPDCYVYLYNGRMRLADHADRRYHRLSLIDAWMMRKGVSFPVAIIQIAQIYMSGVRKPLEAKIRIMPKQPDFNFEIFYKIRAWSKEDRKYWSQYDITREQLELERIFPINYLAFNTQSKPKELTVMDVNWLAYAISIGNRLKVYMPDHKPKTLHNVRGEQIGGNTEIDYDQDLFILNKSAKDHMVISNEGYNSRYLMNEGCKPSKRFINHLSENFEHIIVLMDNDDTGKRESVEVAEYCNKETESYKFIPLTLPDHLNEQFNVSDPSDYLRHFGTLDIIHKMIQDEVQTHKKISELPFAQYAS